MTAHRTATLAALCLAAAALVGCKAAPRTLSESADDRADAGDYWTANGDARLPAPDQPRTVALSEVVVEFVTSKNQAGERRQAAFMPPHPVFLAASAAGMGRRNVVFADDAYQTIADHVAGALVAELRGHGLDPVAADAVRDAAAYAPLETLADDETRDIREINLASTDTGRIRAMRQVPALGAPIITSDDDAVGAAGAALLDELGVDAVLRVHLRVGVYLERASLEEGSRFTLTTPAGATTLDARHSLLSDARVLDESSDGSELVVSLDAYLQAIDATAPAFIALALDALD